MPRCNLTLKQKCQIIELSGDLSTDQLAKKFRVHPTTVTRTIKNKDKILDQASRVNVNFKTVQTNQRGQEHDCMILEYIRARQAANEPLTIKEICDRAVEYALTLDRNIKSKRGWWRRFKVRCNIIKSKLQKASPGPRHAKDTAATTTVGITTTTTTTTITPPNVVKKDTGSERKSPCKRSPSKSTTKSKKKNYTFKVRDSVIHTAAVHTNNNSNNNNSNNDNTVDYVTPIQDDMKPQLPDIYEAMA